MSQSLVPRYKGIVAAAYKSLEHPDFSFVKRMQSARPYEPVIRKLRDYAAIEQISEADDDVCFSYLLKGRNTLWKLDLSLVGPFAIFVRLKSKVTEQDFLYPGKGDLVGFETKIVDIVKTSGVKLMTPSELAIPMPMTLFNTEKNNVRLYQALFSDREQLPWDGAAEPATALEHRPGA